MKFGLRAAGGATSCWGTIYACPCTGFAGDGEVEFISNDLLKGFGGVRRYGRAWNSKAVQNRMDGRPAVGQAGRLPSTAYRPSFPYDPLENIRMTTYADSRFLDALAEAAIDAATELDLARRSDETRFLDTQKMLDLMEAGIQTGALSVSVLHDVYKAAADDKAHGLRSVYELIEAFREWIAERRRTLASSDDGRLTLLLRETLAIHSIAIESSYAFRQDLAS